MELPITCLPPLAHTAPQSPTQPHFCKPLRAPPRWLFKGHPRVIRSVKWKYLSPEAIFFLPSFLVSLFLCLFSLLPCSSVRTQNSSCQCLCRARSQGSVASPPALRLRYRLRVAERVPDSRDQRNKTFPKDACGQKIWAGGNRGASQSPSRMLNFLVRVIARFITYPWGVKFEVRENC